MSSSTPAPSSTDVALKHQKNEPMSTESDVKPTEEELQKQPQEASSPEKSLIELAESVYAIPKGPGTIEQKIDQFLDIFTKLEKQGCEVGEMKNLLETAKESPADFANGHTIPSEFLEAFGKLESIGLRMIETAKAGLMEIIKDETLISDLGESMDMLSQLNKHDLGLNLGALAKCVEKNFNDFIELVNAEKMRKSAEKIRNTLEEAIKLAEKRGEEKRKEEVRADSMVLFICFYLLCIVVGGVAFIVNKFL